MEENKKKETEQSLKYTGTIKVSVRKGKKVYKSRTYHNNGRWPLFSFLADCIAGNYKTADGYRPKYLGLFYAGAKGTGIPTISASGTKQISEYANTQNKRFTSLTPVMTEKARVNDDTNPIGSATVTLKFTVPFTRILTSENKVVNLICLYGDTTFEEYGNPCAFYFIEDDEELGKLGELVPVNELLSGNNDYNLLIEWKMGLNNN